jgi:hypothetical protein
LMQDSVTTNVIEAASVRVFERRIVPQAGARDGFNQRAARARTS